MNIRHREGTRDSVIFYAFLLGGLYMKNKNLSKQLKCKIKILVKEKTNANSITATCIGRNEVLINLK